MSGAAAAGWRTTGLVWRGGEPELVWWAPGGELRAGGPGAAGVRTGALPLGSEPTFAVGADRRCIGVLRAGRRIACPGARPLDPASRSPRCGECARLDRQYSVAADTLLDDPRPYAVYLAHHGSAGIKVGITAAERGLARLLEQGALASVFLSEGTLPSARRVEHLLGLALGLPDRVSTLRKRAARAAPGAPAEREAELLALAARAATLGWPEGQARRRDAAVIDHCARYGLPESGLAADAAVQPLRPGDVVRGRISCRIATDLYLAVPSAGLVLLDTRLLAGWAVSRAGADAAFTAPVAASPRVTEPQQLPGLF
jgi:hypothetical protein